MPRHILFVHGVGDAPFKTAETFKNSIAKENIHDKRDIIASPLSPFFDQCRDFHVKVQNSNPLTAHSNYNGRHN